MTNLPPHLAATAHTDWPWLLKWVPRTWTSFNWGVPVLKFGSQALVRVDAKSGVTGPSPIGEPDSTQVSYYPNAPIWAKLLLLNWYFALTTLRGVHYRFGARWDDVDGYVTWPSLARKDGVTGFGDREPGPYPAMRAFRDGEMLPWKGTWLKVGRVYPWGLLLVPMTPTANRAKRMMEQAQVLRKRLERSRVTAKAPVRSVPARVTGNAG